MRERPFIAAVLAALALSVQSPIAVAVIIGVSRTASDSITFSSAADFSNAATHALDRITYTASAGDSFHSVFAFASPSFNTAVVGDDHVAVSNVVTAALSAEFDVTSVDGLPGTTTLALDRFANIGTTLTTSVQGGLHALTVTRNPSGGVVDGSPFLIAVTLPGDWSATGAGTGAHELIAFNALWTIDENFVFDGSATTFSAHIGQYLNDANGRYNPGLQFRLFGGPAVPEPATAGLLALALVGVGMSRGRRRRPAPRGRDCRGVG